MKTIIKRTVTSVVFIIALILTLVFIGSVDASSITCNSCTNCNGKLKTSAYNTVELVADIIDGLPIIDEDVVWILKKGR